MMKILESGDIDLLSTDLRGYEKYLDGLGYTERHIGFLKLAPRLLFSLFGVYSGLELIKDKYYKTKFLDLIRKKYCAGTLKKYSSGITHYRNYLISEERISADFTQNMGRFRYDPGRVDYHDNKTEYFTEIESTFRRHLVVEMETCKDEVRKKITAYQRFASFIINNGDDSFIAVKGQDILEFCSLKTTFRTDWNKLRSFLKFAYREGKITEDFSGIIIPTKAYRQKHKKYLSKEKIDKILESLPRKNTRDVRTYAMFLLMARLGFRPSETFRVRLKDIDWVNARIFVRGKGNRQDWLPMPSVVAEAIIEYLKCSERGKSGFVFTQERPPYNAIGSSYSIYRALKIAYEQTGISPPTGNVRLNVFRHSFATNLINQEGQSFFTAQVFLRHSSPDMTLHYAKYHAPKLRLFEQAWPGGSSETS